MGINGLITYITKYGNSNPVTERIVGKTIHNTRVIYLDALSKLIEIYNQYMNGIEIPKTYEGLFQYEIEKFTTYLEKISYYKRRVNVFIDYHFTGKIEIDELLFKQYLPQPTEEYKDKPEEWYNYLMRVKCKEHKIAVRRKQIERKTGEPYEDNIFRKLVHNSSAFVEELRNNSKLSNVSFYGCSIEADFAMAKHIHTYGRDVYPIIITTDTDLLALLCDVNCIVKFSVGRKTYFINPIEFWASVFKTNLSHTTIKMLCVMKGIDFNMVDNFIKIKTFDEALTRLNIKSFENLTDADLYAYFYKYFETYKYFEESKYTALALNLYLINMENTFYEL